MTEEPPKRGAQRRQIRFLITFAVLLGGGFALLAYRPVDMNFVTPFTGLVAKASGVFLNVLGQDVTMRGTQIANPRFAVDIENGCNGLETMLIFGSAVLAFPAGWRSRLLGLGGGFAAIQALNLVRVAALFLTGAYLPDLFNASHTLIWQSIVVAFGVILWMIWASRFATSGTETAS